MELILTNNQPETLPDGLFFVIEKLFIRALEYEEMSLDVEVGLTFVDNDEIKDLNMRYRHLNDVTDVLSFALLETLDEEPDMQDIDQLILGDIVVAFDRAQTQAQEYGHSLLRELSYLAVHGMLHLLGYDHQTELEKIEMRMREEELLEGLNITR